MPVKPTDEQSHAADAPARVRGRLQRLLLIGAGLAACVLLVLVLAIALAYQSLPTLDALTDYRPRMPLRVFTADGVLIGEFGGERRTVVTDAEVPPVLKQAIIAAEDGRFYQHRGVDLIGIGRAALFDIVHLGGHPQGASTLTQQVARNFFLSSEQTLTRKFYEVLLAFKIESSLTKDQILLLYINQIYLGQHAYGFASAEQIYYGRELKDISPAEAAMLAALPKAPSQSNPIVNPERARARQDYVLVRMFNLGFLTQAQYERARSENHPVLAERAPLAVHAEYVAELAREIASGQFGEDATTRGMNVYTTIVSSEQVAAYNAVRAGVLAYERRQRYEGPEGFVDLPGDAHGQDEAIEEALQVHSDAEGILAAVVLDASPKAVHAARPGEAVIEITADGLRPAASALGDLAPAQNRLRRGAIIRVSKNARGAWEITQAPKIQAAFVAGSSEDGAVHALVGGFDFNRNKFNHVTQAWRQPGSGFKPFVYSAALEKGFTPATIVNDAPIVIDAAQAGGRTWIPRNYDGRFDGPMTLREAIARSKNMVSIRLLEAITPRYVQDYVGRFGFDPDRQPPYLTLALGAGSVTPWQMIGAYSVFANGGYKINPYLVARITDASGRELARARPVQSGDESNRVIDARNAYVIDSLLRGVARYGTAASASEALRRSDIGGKTGTTNAARDAWFSGYVNQGEVAVVWIGYDQPRSLGTGENGGGLALPLWIAYMQTALKGVPEKERAAPLGIVTVAGEVYYSEYGPGQGVASLGLDDPPDIGRTALVSTGAPASARQPGDTPAAIPYGTLRN